VGRSSRSVVENDVCDLYRIHGIKEPLGKVEILLFLKAFIGLEGFNTFQQVLSIELYV